LLPLPYKEPSQTLFALLGFCVDAGRRLASITDMQVGDSNQNAAVGTTIALLEKGSAVMSSIHKRLHYSQKIEFGLLQRVLQRICPTSTPTMSPARAASSRKRTSMTASTFCPSLTPTSSRWRSASRWRRPSCNWLRATPQMHNMYEAYRRMYEAIGVRDIDQILNTQNVDKPKDPASENAQALDGSPLKAFAGQQHDAHIMTHLMFGSSPLVASMPAVATNLQKHCFDHIRLKAEEWTEAEIFRQYGTDPEGLVSPLQREAMVALKVAEFFQEMKAMQEKLAGNQEDPLVGLKKQELQQNAQRDQARTQIDQGRLALDQQRTQAEIADDQANLQLKAAQVQAKTGFDQANLNLQGAQHAAQVQQQNFQNAQALASPEAGASSQGQSGA